MGKLIIHADDYGISHEVNMAIKDGITKGFIDRATLMVNMPYAKEAVEMAKEGGYLEKIGLHLNLVEGCPLTEEIKKTWLCSNGAFNGEISNKKYKMGLIRDKMVLLCIEQEIDAQMKKFLSWNMPLHHVDSHQHSHIKPSIFPIALKLANKNGFTSIRLASIIPSDSPILPVKIYKGYVNSKFKNFNINHRERHTIFPIIDVGCAYLSLKRQIDIDKGKFLCAHNVEMWFHPSIVNGKIINLFCDAPFSVEDLIEFKRISAGNNNEN